MTKEQQRNPFLSPGLRLIQLYFFLATKKRPYTLTQLTKNMGASRQTVLRLIDQINCIPGVECSTWMQHNQRYYQITTSPLVTSTAFNADTLQHLALCRDIVAHLLPKAVQQELRDALSNAAGHDADDSTMAEPWVKGRIDYTPHQKTLEDIELAMREHRLCRLVYDSRSSGKFKRHLIAPLRMIAYHEAFYLRCLEFKSQGNPTNTFLSLAIHRIKSLETLRAQFDPDIQDDYAPEFGFPVHDPVQVKVAFWGGAASYVEERIWSTGQSIARRKDGALILTFHATHIREVISWVLSFGPDAELLEPEDLRAEFRAKAIEITERYGKDKEDKKPLS